MDELSLTCQANCLSNRFFGDGSTPFFDDGLPRHATRDLLEHIRDEDACPPKCGLAMANGGINYDVTSERLAHGFNSPSLAGGPAVNSMNRDCQAAERSYTGTSMVRVAGAMAQRT